MKNFPHQYNDPTKIRAALEVVLALDQTGANVHNDGVLGYELARQGVYAFRNLQTDLETRIAEERTKPGSSQGARTAARETRRTLEYLGWIDDEARVTVEGQALLATPPQSEEERAMWQQGLSALELEDREGNRSHPIQLLVRLCRAVPLQSREGMELIFVAVDDGETEFARIAGLAQEDPQTRREDLGLTQAKVDNARKILPAFAEFAGLIVRDDTGRFVPTKIGLQVAGLSAEIGPPVSAKKAARRSGAQTVEVTPETAGAARQFEESNWTSLTHDEQMDAIRLRQERTDRHQHLVRKLAMAIGGPLRENPAAFDLLSSHAEEYCVIWEVKTIDGDAASQTRSAVSQLLYYQYFDVAPVSDCDDTAMVVAFEKDIGEELPAFLEHLRIGAVIIEGTGSGLTATNSTGAAILSRIRSS